MRTAREYFLENYTLGLSNKTYEEYIVETSRMKGVLKGELSESEKKLYADNSLSKLRYSNSILINDLCKVIASIDSEYENLLTDYYIGVSPYTAVNAGAIMKHVTYSGHIVDIQAGMLNHIRFFLAPMVTASWYQDSNDDQEKKRFLELLEGQLKDLDYLRKNNTRFRDINKLDVPSFPNDKMQLEHIYYQAGALAFVVLHEIGHHKLGHTHLAELNAAPDAHHQKLRSTVATDAHRREIDADYFSLTSIRRMAKAFSKSENDAVSVEINAYLIGPITGLLSLCYLEESVDTASESHPALVKRLDYSLDHYARSFQQYGIGYGLWLTELYATILHGNDSSVTQSIRRVRETFSS